jgi:hypothetical protein
MIENADTETLGRYLPLYLAEFTFRYNNRKNPDMFGELLSRC